MKDTAYERHCPSSRIGLDSGNVMLGFRPKASALYLPRPRLLDLLPDSPGYVVWLEAPYGYGKSVLASQWAEKLEEEGWRVLWLSVQGRDLGAALAHLLTLPADAPWEVVQETIWQSPTLLVLEDLEHCESLTLLLKEPRGLLLLASRNTLPCAELPRLATQGRLTHLRSSALAFSPDEAGALFADAQEAARAWERSNGWSLPLHFAALTGETPEAEALLEGVRGSLAEADWREALLLATLPYLPRHSASRHTMSLAQAGFVQELEAGYRLHPLAAEAILQGNLAACRAVLSEERTRLSAVLQAEAFAASGLTTELSRLLETETGLGAADPSGLLNWDRRCPPPRGPVRLLNLAWAQSVLGDLGAARESYRAVVQTPAATAEQKLIALGWWIFDLPIEDEAQFRALMAQAEALFAEANCYEASTFLYNASAFYLSTYAWPQVQKLLHRALERLGGCDRPEVLSSVHLRLAQVDWELRGDLEQLLASLAANLSGQQGNPFNLAVNHALLGRYLALLSQEESVHHLEQAELGAAHNLATAVMASAEKAALLGLVEAFPALAAKCRAWQSTDPAATDRLYALWARTLRRAGQPRAALEVLSGMDGVSARAERALAWAAEGKLPEALAHLPDPAEGQQRHLRLELQAARYQLTRDEADLEAILALTRSRERVLSALLPIETLPATRPELSRSYRLEEVLRSGWKEAVALRRTEIPELEFELLGAFKVSLLGEPVGLTDRHKAMLALTALGFERAVIGEALWPETESKKVLNNLHVQLNLLRKLLEPWGLKTYLSEEGLMRSRADLWRLKSALAAGDADAVLKLYREPLAPGVDLPLLEEARAELRQAVIDLLFESAGEAAEKRPYLERILELDPLDEEALQKLLQELLKRGRRREAQRRYQRFAALLKADLGLEPLPETLSLLA